VLDRDCVYRSITIRRAEFLRELANGFTEREISEHLGLTLSGVRSCLEDLRDLTGFRSGREMGRWWRDHRESWLQSTAEAGGISNVPEKGDH